MSPQHLLSIARLRRLVSRHGVAIDVEEFARGYERAAVVLQRCKAIDDAGVREIVEQLEHEFLPVLAAGQPAAAAADKAARSAVASDVDNARFIAAKRALARALTDVLGLDGDALALKAEQCKRWDEFLALSDKSVSIVAQMRGAKQAERVRAQLDAANAGNRSLDLVLW